MKKLVIIFPGAGYGLDCPLLYYADFVYAFSPTSRSSRGMRIRRDSPAV